MRFVLLGVALVFVGAPEAHAYRTHSDADLVQSVSPPVWSIPVTFAVDTTAFTSAERDGVRRAVARSLSNWTSVSCANVDAAVEVSRSTAVIGDGISQIVWVEDWAERGYDSDSLAVTETVYASDGDYADIVEADVYLKQLRVRWSSGSSASDLEVRMIEAVVTHELGRLWPCSFLRRVLGARLFRAGPGRDNDEPALQPFSNVSDS